jgi:hypothetical protein
VFSLGKKKRIIQHFLLQIKKVVLLDTDICFTPQTTPVGGGSVLYFAMGRKLWE